MALSLGWWLPDALIARLPNVPFTAKKEKSPVPTPPTSQALTLYHDVYEAPKPKRPFVKAATGLASDLTARFDELSTKRMSAETRAQLRGKTVVFVRGYLARLYVAAGGTYLDKHAEYCRSLGMQVIMGDVHGGANARSNSESLFKQIMAETTDDDPVIVIAHSYGCVATLELLTSPAYKALHDRIVAFIPINGVFQGTPLAELDAFPFLGRLFGRIWGMALAIFGGDADTLIDMKPASRMAYIENNYSNILNMMQRVTVVPLATSYNLPAGPRDVVGFGMFLAQLYMRCLGLANDGAVPQQSQILPGSTAVVLGGMHHADAIDDFGRYNLEQIMQGLLCVTLECMPVARRKRVNALRQPFIVPRLAPPGLVGCTSPMPRASA